MSEGNPTFLNFDGPTTQIAEYEHWHVLVRPKQATLGALILLAKGPQTAYSALPTAAFTEQARVVGDVETVLSMQFSYDRLNYLMLMMVDPNVHFHVLPRYANPVSFDGWTLADTGWPGPPDLAGGSNDRALTAALVKALQAAWPKVAG